MTLLNAVFAPVLYVGGCLFKPQPLLSAFAAAMPGTPDGGFPVNFEKDGRCAGSVAKRATGSSSSFCFWT